MSHQWLQGESPINLFLHLYLTPKRAKQTRVPMKMTIHWQLHLKLKKIMSFTAQIQPWKTSSGNDLDEWRAHRSNDPPPHKMD